MIRREPITPTEAQPYLDTGVCRLGYIPSEWVYYEGAKVPVMTMRRSR